MSDSLDLDYLGQDDSGKDLFAVVRREEGKKPDFLYIGSLDKVAREYPDFFSVFPDDLYPSKATPKARQTVKALEDKNFLMRLDEKIQKNLPMNLISIGLGATGVALAAVALPHYEADRDGSSLEIQVADVGEDLSGAQAISEEDWSRIYPGLDDEVIFKGSDGCDGYMGACDCGFVFREKDVWAVYISIRVYCVDFKGEMVTLAVPARAELALSYGSEVVTHLFMFSPQSDFGWVSKEYSTRKGVPSKVTCAFTIEDGPFPARFTLEMLPE